MCVDPPGSNYMRRPEVFVASGSVAVLPCVMSSPSKQATAVTWKRITDGYESIHIIYATYNHITLN